MMRRTAFIALAGVAATLAATPGEAQKRLAYAGYVTDSHVAMRTGLTPYFESIKEDTGGDIVWELFPGGSMVDAKGTLGAVRDRVIDGGLIVDLYFTSELPAARLWSDLALFGDDGVAVSGAVNEVFFSVCPSCLQNYLDNNIQPLALYSTPRYLLQCTSPISDLASIAGKKVRAAGSWGRLIAAMGGTPLNLPGDQIYEALQRGVADCTVAPIGFLRDYGLWDSVRYVLDLSLGTYHGGMVMDVNTGTWADLSPEERQAHLDLLPELTRNVAQNYAEEESDIKRIAEEEKGIEWVSPSQDLVDFMQEYRQEELAAVIATAKERGVEGAEELAPAMVETIEKWNRIVAEMDGDYDIFQDALQTNAFSHIEP